MAAQEMGRTPGPADPLEPLVRAGVVDRHVTGPGAYETLVGLGAHADGRAMLTFTAAHGAGDVAHARPSAAYLTMLRRGLRESRDWDEHRVRSYLCGIIDGALPAD